MSGDPRIRLITGALAGQPLSRFMPGADNHAAIRAVVATWKSWTSDLGYAEVRPKGAGLWPEILGDHTPGNAAVFLTWSQILEIIARGCTDDRCKAYEAARQAFRDTHDRKDWDAWRAACDAMAAAEQELISYGLQAEPVQDALF